MNQGSRSLLRFLAVPFVVLLIYGIGVAIYSTLDTQLAPSGPALRALIVCVGVACAFAAVIAGSAVAPRARLLTGVAIVVVTTASQVLQLPAAGTPARALVLWAGFLTLLAGSLALLVVAYRERRRVAYRSVSASTTGA